MHMRYSTLISRQPRGDNTVSVAQGGIATPGATKQLSPPDRVFKRIIYIYIYIYICLCACMCVCVCVSVRQINCKQRLHWTFILIFSVQFVIFKNAFSFGS